jgi:uncharacterized protein
MRRILLDAGPLIALLDKRDSSHGWVTARWEGLTGRLVTSGAVVTEALHQLAGVHGAADNLVEFLDLAHVIVEHVFEPAPLRAMVGHMKRYDSVPMDFADATLVHLAGKLDTGRILTLDERGFRTYRYARNKAFDLVLQNR